MNAAAPGRRRPRHAGQGRPSIPKTAKGLRRKQELIAATARALNRHGFRDLSAAHIVAEAEAPIGLFYRYFENKTEAVLAVLEELISEFRSVIQQSRPDAGLFERILSSHRGVLRLFAERRGVLSCYYTYDYGEPAFVQFFQEQTERFDRDTAAAAIAEVGCKTIVPDDILALAHALTCMIDSFAFRYSMGRDETPTLERAANMDVAMLTAILRYRGFTCADPTSPATLPVFRITPVNGSRRWRRVEMQEPRLAVSRIIGAKRSPKRVDSTNSYRQLRRTALALLNRLSYDDMRITDIEKEGRTTRGSIYHYFGEKRDLALDLLRDRLEAVHLELRATQERFRQESGKTDVFTKLEALARVFVREFEANPGILRTIYQLEGRDADIGTLLRTYRRCWAEDLADLLAQHTSRPGQHRATIDLIAYAMLAMVDRFTYDVYVAPFPGLAERFASARDVSAFVAIVWHRMLFLRHPARAMRKPFAALARLTMQRRRG